MTIQEFARDQSSWIDIKQPHKPKLDIQTYNACIKVAREQKRQDIEKTKELLGMILSKDCDEEYIRQVIEKYEEGMK